MKPGGVLLIAFIVAGIGMAGARSSSGPAPEPWPEPPPPPPPPPPYRPVPSGPVPLPPVPPPPPDPSTRPAPQWVGPGWFWWFVDWQIDGYEYVDFQRRNKGHFNVRKVIGTEPGVNYSVIVFEVPTQPILWTLRGMPMPAPKGIDTELTDLAGHLPEEQLPAWEQYAREVLGALRDKLIEYDGAVQQWLDELLRGQP